MSTASTCGNVGRARGSGDQHAVSRACKRGGTRGGIGGRSPLATAAGSAYGLVMWPNLKAPKGNTCYRVGHVMAHNTP